jgi:hypothetical protein
MYNSLPGGYSLYEYVFQGLPYLIAILDRSGKIVAVNQAWEEHAREHGMPLPFVCESWEDCVYLDILEAAIAQGVDSAQQARQSLEAVLSGAIDQTYLEYKAPWAQDDRRYLLRIKSIRQAGEEWVLISYSDVTESMRHQKAQLQAVAEAVRDEEQQEEIRSLNRLSHPSPVTVTSQSFGLYPLSQGNPELFSDLVQQYCNELNIALERKIYHLKSQNLDHLRDMAQQLGMVKAGPRDVVEIHITSIRQLSAGAAPQKGQAYLEEGRVLVLELMGYLADYYRNVAVVTLRPPTRTE